MQNRPIKNICCIGAGYVGGPSMAVIAKHCPEIEVNVVDTNIERINLWNSKNMQKLPIYEPDLDKVLEICRGNNLFFSANIKESIAKADMIFISVNTPTKTKGMGAGYASDLKWIEASARQIGEFSKGHTIVVEKSTLPVRTAETIRSILKSHATLKIPKDTEKKEKTFSILSNPEFLAEGSAINDLENPDRVLIGGDSNDAIMTLSYIYEKWVPKDRILYTNIWSSELAKLTSNAFLAQRISSINSIAAICEATGADIREVSRAIGSDTRIGSKFLDSSPGFGGSCFKKDILNLVYLSKYFGLYNVAKFWEGVVILNNWHQHRISELVVQKLYGTISGKKIAILGFAFKANTNDTRESAAITICKDLIEEGALLAIHDPKVDSKQIGKDLNIEEFDYKNNNRNFEGGWLSVRNFVDAFEDADAAIFLTEWDLYKIINWKEVSIKMRKPAWIFDSRSIFEPKDIVKEGLKLWRIGDGCPYKK